MNSLKTTILYLIFILALILILIFFLLLPVMDSIKEGKKIIAEKRAELIEKEEKALTLRIWQKNPEELTTKVDQINGLWPDDKDVSKFIVDLEGLANQEDLTLKNISISESATASKSKDKKKELQFSFDIKADFSKNLLIIKKMEKFSRFNTIKQINLTKDEENLVSMKITGTIYYGN